MSVCYIFKRWYNVSEKRNSILLWTLSNSLKVWTVAASAFAGNTWAKLVIIVFSKFSLMWWLLYFFNVLKWGLPYKCWVLFCNRLIFYVPCFCTLHCSQTSLGGEFDDRWIHTYQTNHVFLEIFCYFEWLLIINAIAEVNFWRFWIHFCLKFLLI